MQERYDLSPTEVNRDLLHFPLHTPLWFWFAIFVLGALLGAGLLLVFIGIHNSWDSVTYIAVELREDPDAPEKPGRRHHRSR